MHGSLTYKYTCCSGALVLLLQDFNADDRKQFLKFVWGRTRLPATEADWGSHSFKVTPHMDSEKAAGDGVNGFFPVAHTCFFQLELPRYTKQEAMKVRKSSHACVCDLGGNCVC